MMNKKVLNKSCFTNCEKNKKPLKIEVWKSLKESLSCSLFPTLFRFPLMLQMICKAKTVVNLFIFKNEYSTVLFVNHVFHTEFRGYMDKINCT